MIRQKSFQTDSPTLYLVATPIGNLDEFSNRAIEVLKNVDVIAAEDTRNTGVLLKKYGIETKMITYHLYNEDESSLGIIKLLEEGKNVAVVSDAGYPLVSDPGELLVRRVINLDYPVVVINGPSALLAGLVASGLKTQPFTFYGFLPSKANERKDKLKDIRYHKETLIFYEAPHRIGKTLEDMMEIFGDRKICVARELTKIFEEYLRGRISEILPVVSEIKGEIVLIVDGYEDLSQPSISLADLMKVIDSYVEEGMSASSAIKKAAKEYGYPKNMVYDAYFN